MTFDELKEKAHALPLKPGVYIMQDKHNVVIYVGKAKALKNRVSQYFADLASHTEKTRAMVSQIDHFDVIVADGFTGNVALKSVEGAGKFVLSRLKAAMGESLKNKIGMALLAGSLKSMAAELSGDEYGGAILLGLRAPVLKGHGATSARAVERGTLFAASVVRAGLVERVADLCDVSA